MTSSRPYLIRALYDWIVDNDHTPYVLVDAGSDQVVVPREYIDKGKIVLNISPTAVHALLLSNDEVSFSARFSGKAQEIRVPISHVLAIYARENGQGMMFNEDEETTPPPSGPKSDNARPAQKKPILKVVK